MLPVSSSAIAVNLVDEALEGSWAGKFTRFLVCDEVILIFWRWMFAIEMGFGAIFRLRDDPRLENV